MIRSLVTSLAIMLVFTGCIRHSSKTLSSKKVIKDGREMLYGAIDLEQLYYDYPGWKQIEEEYNPSTKIISQITKYLDSISVDIFMGTWCSDSEREVPAFLKIIKEIGGTTNLKIHMWAVDRNKRLDNDLAEKCNIEFVPTFILYKSNREIGRIVEMPDGLLEEDILNIISKKN